MLYALHLNKTGIPKMTLFSSFFRRSFGAAAVTAVLWAVSAPVQAYAGPFSGLEGSWSGNGTIVISGGGKESIRCRATYNVEAAGNALQQRLRCASDSYRFDLSSDVRAQGSTLSGVWNESSRGINGTVEGRARAGEFEALVSANGFAASLHVQTKGNRQIISIDSKNTDLQGVNITLSR
jgi:hypothetical protein